MTLPAHITHLINARTGQDLDQPTGRDRVTRDRCPRCHAPILAGLDDDTAGLPATADPTPLDRAGEAQALLTGRATYTLARHAGRLQLRHRDHWTIAGHPADPAHHEPVLPAHACGQPLAPTRTITGRAREVAHEQPPF